MKLPEVEDMFLLWQACQDMCCSLHYWTFGRTLWSDTLRHWPRICVVRPLSPAEEGKGEEKQEASWMVFYNLILEVTPHHFCHVLFKSKSLSPAHTQGESIKQGMDTRKWGRGESCGAIIGAVYIEYIHVFLSWSIYNPIIFFFFLLKLNVNVKQIFSDMSLAAYSGIKSNSILKLHWS